MTTTSESSDEDFSTENLLYPVLEEPEATATHGTILDSADASNGEEPSSKESFMNADSVKPSWIVDEKDGVIVWLHEDNMEKSHGKSTRKHHRETNADKVASEVKVGWSPGGAANDRHDIIVENTGVDSQRDVERSPIFFY